MSARLDLTNPDAIFVFVATLHDVFIALDAAAADAERPTWRRKLTRAQVRIRREQAHANLAWLAEIASQPRTRGAR